MAIKTQQRQKEKCASFSLSWNPREKSLCHQAQKEHTGKPICSPNTHTASAPLQKNVFSTSAGITMETPSFSKSLEWKECLESKQSKKKKKRTDQQNIQTCGKVKVWGKDWNTQIREDTLEAFPEGLSGMQIRGNPLFNSLITTWITKWIKEATIYTLLPLSSI